MKYFWGLLLSFFLLQTATAQNPDSLHVKISLLTCAPGNELYSTFGHTAIRIIDSTQHSDFVFNYGTFDFDQPNFYLKFVRGKLNFMVDAERFYDFIYEYQITKRSVVEQDLRLSNEQKKFIIDFLYNNYLPANRYYKYDFLFDNCATRIRDILFKKTTGVRLANSIIPPNTTSRDLIYYYLDKAGQPWSKLGIDLLLGSVMDRKIDNNAAMFLPDFLSKGVAHATINGKPYVLKETTILNAPTPIQPSGKYMPLIVITIICICFLFLFYIGRKNKLFTNFLDVFLLYISGLLGLLMLFMWFCTDHQTCANNYNLLWALPTNFIAAFFIWKKKEWIRKYFFFATVITALLLAFWFELPQHFNIALIPFVLLMLTRYGKLARKLR